MRNNEGIKHAAIRSKLADVLRANMTQAELDYIRGYFDEWDIHDAAIAAGGKDEV